MDFFCLNPLAEFALDVESGRVPSANSTVPNLQMQVSAFCKGRPLAQKRKIAQVNLAIFFLRNPRTALDVESGRVPAAVS